MPREKETRLMEIVKGGSKGLVGAFCVLPFVGLPAADGLYHSIETKEGKLAYGIAGGLLITTGFAILYSIGN